MWTFQNYCDIEISIHELPFNNGSDKVKNHIKRNIFYNSTQGYNHYQSKQLYYDDPFQRYSIWLGYFLLVIWILKFSWYTLEIMNFNDTYFVSILSIEQISTSELIWT